MTAHKPGRSGPFSMLYIGFWCAIGAAAVGYIAITAGAPPTTASAPPATTGDFEQRTTELHKLVTLAGSEISAVRKDMAGLRTDVEAIRTQSQAHEDRDRQLLARIAAVEERVAVTPARAVEPPAPIAPATTTAPKVPEKADPRRLKPRVSQLTTGTAPQPATQPAEQTAEAPLQRLTPAPTAPITTVAAPVTTVAAPAEAPLPLAPPAQRTQPPARVYGVRLASGNTLDELRLSWSAINESNRDVLGTLQPRYQKGAGQSPYQLIAGPFRTEAEAGRACQTLAQKGLACAPAPFAGQGL